MAAPSVTYSFVDATTIVASEVNQNFTDIINGITDGNQDLTVSAFTANDATVLNGAVTVGNATGDDVALNGRITTDIDPKTAATNTIGDATQTWLSLYLNGGVTDGGAIYFDASSTKFIKSNAAGTDLLIDAFTTLTVDANIVPQTDVTNTLGTSSLNYTGLHLDNGATDGGAVFFNAGTTAFLKSNAAGSTLSSGGFTTCAFAAITASTTLGVTGIATFTAAPVFSSVTASQTLEVGAGKALQSVAITGTGSYVKSISPTFTGTVGAAAITATGETNALTGGFGITRTEGTLHVHTASSGAVTASTGADDLVVENSGDAGLSILGAAANTMTLALGSPNDNDGFRIEYTPTDGKSKIYTNATLAMTMDSVADISFTGNVYAPINTGSAFDEGNPAYSFTGDTNTGMFSEAADNLNFSTAGVKALNIDSTQNVSIGTTSATYRCQIHDSAANRTLEVVNSNASPFGIIIDFSTAAINAASNPFVSGIDSDDVSEFNIFSDGSFVQTSDSRLKENITETEPTLDRLMRVDIVNYNRIGDASKGKHVGVIAQDLEKQFPHLVSKAEKTMKALDKNGKFMAARIDRDKNGDPLRDEGGEIIKHFIENGVEVEKTEVQQLMVYKTGLIFPMIKAIQEQQEIIESLKSRIEKLEGAS